MASAREWLPPTAVRFWRAAVPRAERSSPPEVGIAYTAKIRSVTGWMEGFSVRPVRLSEDSLDAVVQVLEKEPHLPPSLPQGSLRCQRLFRALLPEKRHRRKPRGAHGEQ